MDPENQAPPPEPPEWDAEPAWTPSPAPGPIPPAATYGALSLALMGLVAVVLGQAEAAFLVSMAAVFFLAQAADLHPLMAKVYALLAWTPPVLGGGTLLGLAVLLGRAPHTPLRTAFAALSAAGVLACAALLFRAVADPVARALLHEREPGHVSRLAARCVVATLWISLPAWVALRDQIATMLRDPASLVGADRLTGSLVGYVVLAFAAVGWGLRRDGRGALERLGLTPLRSRDVAVIGLGVVALWVFNAASEAVERAWFPALWRVDQRFTESLAGVMGPGLMVLLGLSAGVGEEITLRGALQPRLGLVMTALLFALLHVQYSWFGMASVLVFGLVLGTIRRQSSTTAAIVVHGLYDLLAIAASRHGP